MLSDGTISFSWNDGPVLKAIKEGHWILLDEVLLFPRVCSVTGARFFLLQFGLGRRQRK